MIKLVGEQATHVGNVREVNQDRGYVSDNIYAVADGMGGHRGGEVAAALTISIFDSSSDELSKGELAKIATDANELVFERSEEDDLLGMGTTLVAIGLHTDQSVEVINVGDSRCYWLRDGYLAQVTRDHSFVEDLLEQNEITQQEAVNHPKRNIITRALGIAPEVEVDSFSLNVDVGDRFMMCSDGLTDEVSEVEIVDIMMAFEDPKEVAEKLVEKALENGGKDNITTVVVDVMTADSEKSVEPPMPVASETELEQDSEETITDTEEDSPDPVTEEISPIGSKRPSVSRILKEPKAQIFVWFCVGVFALIGFLAARNYSQNNWFVEEDPSGFIAVYRGQPGGFLWFDPSKKSLTEVVVADLQPSALAELSETPTFGSAEEAREFATTLEVIEVDVARESQDTTPRTILTFEDPNETGE